MDYDDLHISIMSIICLPLAKEMSLIPYHLGADASRPICPIPVSIDLHGVMPLYEMEVPPFGEGANCFFGEESHEVN